MDSVDYVLNAEFISGPPAARCTPPPMQKIAGIRLYGIYPRCSRAVQALG